MESGGPLVSIALCHTKNGISLHGVGRGAHGLAGLHVGPDSFSLALSVHPSGQPLH